MAESRKRSPAGLLSEAARKAGLAAGNLSEAAKKAGRGVADAARRVVGQRPSRGRKSGSD